MRHATQQRVVDSVTVGKVHALRQPCRSVTPAWLLALATLLLVAPLQAGKLIDPETATWLNPPALPGVTGSWLIGGENDKGLYQFRVRMQEGARIPPHTHPDPRNTTVLSGTLWVGFGDTVNEDRMLPVRAGSIYEVPAKVPHYLWAKEGAVEYQESGVGPSATHILGPNRD
ncbi:MAG TPA: cupin domain-containing protein [Porticoccaceae bacterium]